MTVYDQFIAIVPINFLVGIFMMILAMVDFTGLTYIQSATGNIPNTMNTSTENMLFNNAKSISLFFPTVAFLLVITLVTESFILSWFVKAHPLSAIIAIGMLIVFMIVAIYVSNTAVQVFRYLAVIPQFTSILSGTGFILFIWINMPAILAICTMVDIAIALTSASRS